MQRTKALGYFPLEKGGCFPHLTLSMCLEVGAQLALSAVEVAPEKAGQMAPALQRGEAVGHLRAWVVEVQC